MTVTTFAEGTQTAVIGTEHFLSSPNVAGKFTLALDLSNMASGDVLEIRAYKMAKSGGTSRAMWYQMFSGAQPSYALILVSQVILNSLTDANALRFSIKQTFGTGKNYDWNVQLENDTATAGSLAAQAQTDVRSALTAQGYTAARAPNLDNADAAVSSRLASASYTAPDSAATIASAVWSSILENGQTATWMFRVMFSALAGLVSGADVNVPKFRDMANTKNRIDAVTDANGNRSIVTLDGS